MATPAKKYKPCPFCGKQPDIYKVATGYKKHGLSCEYVFLCNCPVMRKKTFRTKKQAEEVWETRYNPKEEDKRPSPRRRNKDEQLWRTIL
jgi:hypothetical protein